MLTFITVAVSSWRVSKLNIVAAIRDITDSKSGRAGRSSLIWGVVGVLFAAGMIALGQASGKLFPFALGVTTGLLALALIVRYLGVGPRPVFTVVGALIFLYWSLPQNVSDALFGKLTGDVEMFFLSGMGMVVGSTLILVFNADLLTRLVQRDGGRGMWLVPLSLAVLVAGLIGVGVAYNGRGGDISQLLYMAAGLCGLLFLLALFGTRAQRFGPALKMAIAYPLANRFRTSMTIAMFSLIVFSITVMSTLTANFGKLFVSDVARAGWDIAATVNNNNPVPDFAAALRDEGFKQGDTITAIGRTTYPNTQEVRQAGSDGWKKYPIVAGDAAFYQGIDAKLVARARGFASDAAVWDALHTQPNVAIVDGITIQGGFGGDPDALNVSKAIKRDDFSFPPLQLEVQDPVTKKLSTLTVIGVTDTSVAQQVVLGVYTNVDTYRAALGPARLNRVFLKLRPGSDAVQVNRDIKAALVMRGVQSFDLRSELKEAVALQVGFNQIFQAFMALGLLVGVAALGVIAFRSVVERRQQIGMLRAIGYQKGTVALSFIMESAFISVLGVLAGVIGATILSRNLLNSGEFAQAGTVRFFIPWLTVISFLVAGFAFALLMTWLPARRAAGVPIAEALRYE